jgi:hypothetical protein
MVGGKWVKKSMSELDKTLNKTTSEQEVAVRIADAAKRASEEADARRAAEKKPGLPPERGGPKGPEPTRYGDWERKCIISDF